MAGTCECSNEPSGSVKCGKFVPSSYNEYFYGVCVQGKDEVSALADHDDPRGGRGIALLFL